MKASFKFKSILLTIFLIYKDDWERHLILPTLQNDAQYAPTGLHSSFHYRTS